MNHQSSEKLEVHFGIFLSRVLHLREGDRGCLNTYWLSNYLQTITEKLSSKWCPGSGGFGLIC